MILTLKSLPVVLLLVVACANPRVNTRVDDGQPMRVAASIFPIAFAASRVGGDQVAVRDLTPAGGEAHDAEINSRELDLVLDADLFLYLGSGFQPSLDRAAKQSSNHKVDLLKTVKTVAQPRSTDPHIWLDPKRYISIVGTIGKEMGRVDPRRSEEYKDRAKTFARELEKLDQDFVRTLSNCKKRDIATTHAAFGYLADRFELTEHSLESGTRSGDPTPGALAKLSTTIRDKKIKVIFSDRPSDRWAETVARETGAKTKVLYTLESLPRDKRDATYQSLMSANLEELKLALEC